MKRLVLVVVMLAVVGAFTPTDAVAKKREQARREVLSRSRGYYKDLFMDGGVALTSRTFLPAVPFLGLSLEYFISAKGDSLAEKNASRQAAVFCGNEDDSNGWLLYPDGSPRYRMIYVNGGSAIKHARSMGEAAAEHIQKYVANGGSYLGTCAGAFIASKGGMDHKGKVHYGDKYWHLWQGFAHRTRLTKSSTAMQVERKSPLLRYFDFGGDYKIDSVRHNGGCYAYDGGAEGLVAGTEPLTRYVFKNNGKVKIDGKISSWAYKPSAESGRVVLCGSHPEAVGQGERLEYMSAMMLYAMDGNAKPTVKGDLQVGEVREMDKRTEDNDPAYTRIGDRQYHHFVVDVPRKCKKMTIKLDGYKGENNFDLTLCAKYGELAFHDNTLIKDVSRGCKKQLVVEKPRAGRWYVSVFCETTVNASVGRFGTYYRTNRRVLNGVPYKVVVEY
ncbi:MAG: hypothetical protein IKC42_05030 [Alistipes sp.]|nr:hypothetical protein [Alistipes sp.]